jgi:hemoglobin/transferrin/lactoferrin receptor protein
LILPAGAVGLVLAGQPVVQQAPGGAVFVAASSNPVLVRANLASARVQGFEGTLEWNPSRTLAFGTVLTWLRARELSTGAPPNIEGGTPAPEGYLTVRYVAPGTRWWVEPYVHAAARQARLSSLDLEDRRTGATRSRSSISSFFLNGATARGWVSPGSDHVPGTPDDVLAVTGETLAQIQDRVLGPGVPSAPLFTAVRGYVTTGIRGGVRAGRHQVFIDAENLGDTNYRGISWGVDAPGRGVSIKYVLRLEYRSALSNVPPCGGAGRLCGAGTSNVEPAFHVAPAVRCGAGCSMWSRHCDVEPAPQCRRYLHEATKNMEKHEGRS